MIEEVKRKAQKHYPFEKFHCCFLTGKWKAFTGLHMHPKKVLTSTTKARKVRK